MRSENYSATMDEHGAVHVVFNEGHFKVDSPMDYVADDVAYTHDNGIVEGVVRGQ